MSDFNDYKMNDEVSDDDDEVRTLEAKDYGKVAFTETFDSGKLSYILEHKDSYRDMFGDIDPKYNPFVIAKKYLDASCKGRVNVEYTQPRPGFGRFYAKYGMSMQGFKRGLRHAIGQEHYIDIDIVNCHPVLLSQMCVDFEIKCPLLNEYVLNRGEIMKEMATLANTSESAIKRIVLCLINGGQGDYLKLSATLSGGMPKWLKDFRKESKGILDRVAEIYPSDYDEHKKMLIEKKIKRNYKASFNSLLMCNNENDLLMTIVKYFNKKGRVKGNAVLCFDGVQLGKDQFPDDNELTEMLRECERYLRSQCGFEVKLKVKPMDEGFTVPLSEGEVVPRYVDKPYLDVKFDDEDGQNVCRSDTGLSEIFVKYVKTSMKVYTADGDAYIWSDKHLLWEVVHHKLAVNQVSLLLDLCLLHFIDKAKTELSILLADETPKSDKVRDAKSKIIILTKVHTKVLGHGGSIGIFAKARSGLFDDQFPNSMNTSVYELPTKGGQVVNMKTGVGRLRDRGDRWSYELDVKYLPTACFKDVKRFIEPMFCFDQSLVGYMQKMLGCCLTGVLMRTLFIWYGEGRNGKSSLAKLLGSMLTRTTRGRGTGFEALSKEIFITDPRAFKGSKSSHAAHLMPLKGLRCGVSSELDDRELLDTQTVRLITGGGRY